MEGESLAKQKERLSAAPESTMTQKMENTLLITPTLSKLACTENTPI